MDKDFDYFKTVVKEKTGLSITDDSGRIREEISRLMARKNIHSFIEYGKNLLYDQAEFHRLLEILTVNETYFFREPAHFDILTHRLIPQFVRNKKPIKIVCAGCSTGEEPFSIAIKLRQHFKDAFQPDQFSIVGIDIDHNAIRKAKEGVYRGQSFRNLDPDTKSLYFDDLDGNRRLIKDELKKSVAFEVGNLVHTPYPPIMEGADIIFYRNVSIYFDPNIQKRIFENLSTILNDHGYLFVSSTETLSHDFKILSLIEIDGFFLFKKEKNTPSIPKDNTSLPDHPRKNRSTPLPSKKTTFKGRKSPLAVDIYGKRKAETAKVDYSYPKALELAQEKKYSESLEILDHYLPQAPEDLKGLTLKAGVLLNLRKTDEARKLCIGVLEKEPLTQEAYLLLGLIAKLENKPDDAMKRFKETAYVNPNCWLAHFYIAQIYQEKGMARQAGQSYKTVMRLLDKGHFPDHGLSVFQFSFSETQIKQLCKSNIEKLS